MSVQSDKWIIKMAKENALDKRPMIGIPSWFKGSTLTKSKK